MQWSHEFDLVACGFVSSLVSAGSLFFTFVSWPLFCSSVKHSHPCFPPRNESKVYRGVILRGFIYLFFRRFALGWISIYIHKILLDFFLHFSLDTSNYYLLFSSGYHSSSFFFFRVFLREVAWGAGWEGCLFDHYHLLCGSFFRSVACWWRGDW